MKLNFLKLVPSAALLCFLVSSCKKTDTVNPPSPSQTGSPLTRTTSMIGAMDMQSDLVMDDVMSNDSSSKGCPMVTYDPSDSVYPYTKTVDYGSGCTDDYGITTSGKRFTTVYADRSTAPAGKVVSVTTYDNYYVNGVSISGQVKVTVVTSGKFGPLVLRVVGNKSVSDTYGNTSSWVSEETQTQIAGIDTRDSSKDDVYQITETQYGTEVSGDSAMVTWKSESDPANPIIKDASCDFRSKGALNITLKQLGVETDEYLDYGNGNCDTNATLSVNNGKPQQITLPFYFFAGVL